MSDTNKKYWDTLSSEEINYYEQAIDSAYEVAALAQEKTRLLMQHARGLEQGIRSGAIRKQLPQGAGAAEVLDATSPAHVEAAQETRRPVYIAHLSFATPAYEQQTQELKRIKEIYRPETAPHSTPEEAVYDLLECINIAPEPFRLLSHCHFEMRDPHIMVWRCESVELKPRPIPGAYLIDMLTQGLCDEISWDPSEVLQVSDEQTAELERRVHETISDWARDMGVCTGVFDYNAQRRGVWHIPVHVKEVSRMAVILPDEAAFKALGMKIPDDTWGIKIDE